MGPVIGVSHSVLRFVLYCAFIVKLEREREREREREKERVRERIFENF